MASNFSRIVLVAVGVTIICGFASCRTTKKIFKAKPAPLSGFVEDQRQVKLMDGDGPFHSTWTAASADQLSASKHHREIYIAPVDTRNLRPIAKGLAGWTHQRRDRREPVDEMAALIEREFSKAFQSNPKARYRVVPQPTNESVTLELALVELDPTSVSGNVGKKAATSLVTPAAMAAGRFTRGKIAIEGKLKDSTGGWLLFQFADREHDKMTFWNVQDFRPYGHTKIAIREWARQFEEITRRSDWQQMKDTRIFRLRPY